MSLIRKARITFMFLLLFFSLTIFANTIGNRLLLLRSGEPESRQDAPGRRLLDLPEAQDRRAGTLWALYRHVGKNLKFGVGYNFTDFSDDLTDLSYDHQGVFVNVIGQLNPAELAQVMDKFDVNVDRKSVV